MPFYAALLSLLTNPPLALAASQDNGPDEVQPAEKTSVGRIVLEDLVKAFRTWTDERRWRETRLMVSDLPFSRRVAGWTRLNLQPKPCQIHLFAHLTVTGAVSASSYLALLQSFLSVLDELGVSPARAERVVICVGEGLIRVCRLSFPPSSHPLSGRTYLQSCSLTRNIGRFFFA
jgi:hypothetical protein